MLRPVPPVDQIPQATAELAWKVNPRGTDEMRVRDALGPLFTDTDFTTGVFADMYPNLGQPGLSPALLTMVMILQHRHNLSDDAAARAVADRISWKYALGLNIDDPGFDPSVLTEFRVRLIDNDRATGLLDLMLDRLKTAGLVRAGGRQRTDATHVIACVRRLNRIEVVGETLRLALETIAVTSPEFVRALLEPGWNERYGRKVESDRLLGRGNASSQVLAAQIGADGAKLLYAIDSAPTARWMNTLPAVELLRTVWQQQYVITPTSPPRWRTTEEVPRTSEVVQSPHDPDARYGKKRIGTTTTEWVGSKDHLTETCDQDLPHLVTDVHTARATDPDVTATTAIQDRLASRGLTPSEHLADAGYPSASNIAASTDRGITLVAPVTVHNGRNAGKGMFTPMDFRIDWAAGTATCPAGATATARQPGQNGLVPFQFSARACRPCPIRDRCTRSKAHVARRLLLHPEPVHKARTAAYTAQSTKAWRQIYNQRAGIESTISEAVRGPDVRHARYRGLAKQHLQNVLGAMAINIGRLGTWFDPTPTAPRPPTRVHSLCASTI